MTKREGWTGTAVCVVAGAAFVFGFIVGAILLNEMGRGPAPVAASTADIGAVIGRKMIRCNDAGLRWRIEQNQGVKVVCLTD